MWVAVPLNEEIENWKQITPLGDFFENYDSDANIMVIAARRDLCDSDASQEDKVAFVPFLETMLDGVFSHGDTNNPMSELL